MTKLLQQCFLFFIVVVIPGHNLGNIQVSVNRTIGPTLVYTIDDPGVTLTYFTAMSNFATKAFTGENVKLLLLVTWNLVNIVN